MDSNPNWPLFGLRIRTERVELRYPDDADIARIVKVAEQGIHDPSTMPFTVPWTRRRAPELGRGIFRHHWECRAGFGPEKWKLILAVVVEGEVVGSQSMSSFDFGVRRTVETGSWLGRAHQGKGLGKHMRACALGLAFEGLDARHAHSDVYDDNAASLALNRKLGYEEQWGDIDVVEGIARPWRRFHLTRELWEKHVRNLTTVEIEGLDGCRSMFVGSASDS